LVWEFFICKYNLNKYKNAKSQVQKDAALGGLQAQLNRYIESQPRLTPVFGGKGGVYPQINAKELAKGNLSLNKVYAFRPGGSVEVLEKEPFGWAMQKLGFPADTFGSFSPSGINPLDWAKALLKAVAPPIAARLILTGDDKFTQEFMQKRAESGQQIHDIPLYNAPGMHYQVNIPMNNISTPKSKSQIPGKGTSGPSGPIPIGYDVDGKWVGNTKKSSKRSALSLDEPIVRGKSKKSNWRSELNGN